MRPACSPLAVAIEARSAARQQGPEQLPRSEVRVLSGRANGINSLSKSSRIPTRTKHVFKLRSKSGPTHA
jgi:hypothetical protein